jgi:uncharacterized protein
MTTRQTQSIGSSTRIDAADVLRGIAVLGILLLHSVEHFNYYRFPETSSCTLLAASDKAIWDSLFFAFSGKAYAIFSLLFGFTFFLQDDKCRRQGRDFRLRFVWRMVLLFAFGNLNAAFFPGEVLVLYSIVGLVLPLVARLPDRVVLALAVVLLLQPDFIFATVRAIAGVEPAAGGGYVPWWRANMDALAGGGFWASIRSNLWDGQMFSILWARDFGRMVQSPALMMIGMLIGRRRLLDGTPENLRFWMKAALVGLLCYFPLNGLAGLAPQYIQNEGVARSLGQLLGAWHKLAFMVFITGTIFALFHGTRLRNGLARIATPIGRMSLTMYIAQSILGSVLFLPWGLDLGSRLGSTASFGVGIGMFIILYTFALLWLDGHRQGPLEWLWRKATWLGASENK